MTSDSLAAVTAIRDRLDAEELLHRECSPALVRAVALRADEVRFLDPGRAVGIAQAAVKALSRLLPGLQDPAVAALAWAVYGSVLRCVARLEEAEAALRIAARAVDPGDPETEAYVARRLAYLKAEQRRPYSVKPLLNVSLDWGARLGGRAYGEELVGAGAILMIVSDYESAAPLTEASLSYLPRNGDRYHLSAVFNLARCRLELDSTPADLDAAARLALEAERYIEAGTYPEYRSHWLRGLLLQRLGQLDQSLEALTFAQTGIDARPNGLDQALLMLDLAELHLERGDAEAARQLALSSFPTLKLLRTDLEAYRALRTFHRAAQDEALDSAVIASVRDRLDAS